MGNFDAALGDEKEGVIFIALGDDGFFRFVEPFAEFVVHGLEFLGTEPIGQARPYFQIVLLDRPFFSCSMISPERIISPKAIPSIS
jgi:hypothetical protein